jgi:putative FmdB family regulatory protein
MPIYEYECNKCGNKFDYLMFLSKDNQEVKCPKCASTDVQRVISRFATKSADGACDSSPTQVRSYG